jgi:hypothetical protein
MMDERQIREEAWLEGAYAVTGLSPATAFTVPNPYAPDYTPSLQAMNTVLLSKFSQLEIWRGEKQRDNKLAAHVRVKVVEKLGVMIRHEEYLAHLTGGRSLSIKRIRAIKDCIAMIRKMKV